ncbi:MAG: ABC-F family ATP-binding cassette domain-containing protein [Verrucomicrobiales bacterium]|nr:ABC-F family ATP-binding cassette domain-containing protein [Verrucomicrobiales bacterium]
MLSVEKVSIGFAGRTLFDELSFVVRAKERVGLAGPNGAGKSTLLKIVIGKETPDSGRIVRAKQITTGYLPQEGVMHSGRTLFAETETAFDDVIQLKAQLAEVETELDSLDHKANPERYTDLLEVFGDVQLRLEHHDVGSMKPRIETILGGLGFSKEDMQRQTEEFSGGWQMRIALAKLLLREPSVLLLDEPTNHLDIETVQWLEQWLKNYGGAILLISHDLSLLDSLTTRTIAFENGRVQHYAGNYSFYLKERDARKEQLKRSFKNQQREIERAEKLIDRFRAKASKAKMVQSRIKQLDKVERIELEDEADSIGFRFPQPERGGHSVLKLEKISKNYEDLQVLDGIDFEITREDRIAIVGVNGAGKSTFSRIIAGVEDPSAGECTLGHKAVISYFSQTHADELDPSRTVLETVEATVSRQAAGNLRTLLGSFLFKGDDVFKQVSVLSGGERSRLALARMLLKPANFLVLDEPTNHLDIQSQEVLQKALASYTGTYAIVSHNRSFLDPLVTKVLEFVPQKPPRLFHGNLSDYLDKKAEEKEAQAAKGVKGSGKLSAVGGGNRKEQRRLEAQQRQQRSKVLKPLQERLETVETLIAKLESEKPELLAKLGNAEFFKSEPDLARVIAHRFKDLEYEMQKAYSDWDAISEDLERAEAELGAN